MFSPATVLVTGANRGIGLEFIKQLINLNPAPAHVFAACRVPDAAKELKEIEAQNKSVCIVQIDVNDDSTMEAAVKVVEERVSDTGLTCLISNGAVCSMETLDTANRQQMMEVFSVNCVGQLMLVKMFLPLLRLAAKSSDIPTLSINRAAVINISSICASISDNRTSKQYAYRASKAALNMVSKNLSIDLKDDGIMVNMLHPGWVKTEMGGPNALIDTQTSVNLMFNECAKLHGDDKTGIFFNNQGAELAF